ncbi:MAG: hypothetical protein JO217_14460 [Acidobacteriaceae bacterium]|nr:hypothetical protein [Acidobacteriaceae bacterium]
MKNTQTQVTRSVAPNRKNFRQLVIQNPNHFGNIKNSPFKAVIQQSGNTDYEELGCVGFQPQLNLLNAVVYIELPYGFDGDLCTAGSQEYVRFYASYDGGKTWTDLGLTSFTAYDVTEPAGKPFERLEYAVTLPFSPTRRFCTVDNFALVRAILSWDVPPPPNDPAFVPVWGNAHDTTIKIDPLLITTVGAALAELGIKPTDPVSQAIDLNQTVKTPTPGRLSVAQLQQLYEDKNIAPQRYALSALNEALETTPDVRLMAANFAGASSLFGASFDVAAAYAAIENPNGDTSYERLNCIGFNENTFALEGVLLIKQAYGYDGGPCTAGSTEYVTFWADLDFSGKYATCLGTTSVRVHDTANLPPGDLEYGVELPTTLFAYRQPCSSGPKLIPIRAILSWQVAPPCSNPNYVPVWGNRLETLICLPPGLPIQQGVQSAFFDTIGSMSVTKINAVTGLADGPSTVGFTAVQSPFGGRVTITGYIYPASNLSAGALPFKYRISVSNDGGVTWTGLNDVFTVSRQLIPWGGVPTALPDVTQSVDISGITTGYYTYQADWITGPGDALIVVAGNVLAQWYTLGKPDGLYQIKMDVYDPSTSTFFPAVNTATILLDNTPPAGLPYNAKTPFINITSGGGSCGDFHVGDKITGSYAVSDLHFYDLSLELLPPSGGAFTAPVPLPRFWTDPGASTLGDSGTWTLDTTGLPPCGYVVVLNAYDRTIVDSGFIGNYNDNSTGFCLKA